MVKKTAALLLATSLLLSACGVGNESSSSTSGTSGNIEANEPTQGSTTPSKSGETDPEKTKPEDNKADQAGNQTAEDNDPGLDSSNNEQETVPIKYHMNKAYNIVPNDEAASKKVILLTFDDGPKKAEMINGLIDTLDKHHAKAIFFVNGYRVKQNPDLLKLIHSRGQIIGNHSWDHIQLKNEPEEKVRQQIEDVQKIVKENIGEAPVFFRPPFGAGGDIGKKIAKENHLLYMTWSNGSLDWTMKSSDKNNPENIVKNVLDQLHGGSNILMHELPWTVEALDNLLTTLEGKGYTFVDPRSIDLEMK